jgi:hypothetical protein
VEQVQDNGGGQEPHGHHPGPALTPEDAAGQHHEADAGQGHQGPGGLNDPQRQVLADQVEVAGHRAAHGHQQVHEPGGEDRPGRQPADASDPDPVGGHVRRRRP